MQAKTTFTKVGREKSKRLVNQIETDNISEKLENDYSNLSFKAVGILLYLESKSKYWKFDEKDLYNRFKDGVTAVRSGIRELKEHSIIIERPCQGSGLQGKEWVLTL